MFQIYSAAHRQITDDEDSVDITQALLDFLGQTQYTADTELHMTDVRPIFTVLSGLFSSPEDIWLFSS